MKRLLYACTSCAPLLLAACATPHQDIAVDAAPHAGQQPAASKPGSQSSRVVVNDGAGNVTVEKVPFRPGTSSATVERLARGAGCAGAQGAGLMTEKGPVEVYRMQCDDGRVFMARCELRQCRPMR